MRRLFALTLASGLVLSAGGALAQPAAERELVIADDDAGGVPAPNPRAKRPPPREPLDVVTVFGIRGSLTHVRGGDAVAGAELGGVGVAYDTQNLATLRLAHFAFIGGGSGGVEGGIGLAYAMGMIAPIEPDHGPFSRIGGRAQLFGNEELYASLVELPELQLGYQLLRKNLHVELAARGGAVLVGRYSPDDARRPLGKAFEWGGLLSLRVDAIHLDVEFMRIEARASDPDTPVDVLSGMLCGAAFPLGVCFDARRYSGDVRPRASLSPLEVTSTYFGITIGGGNSF